LQATRATLVELEMKWARWAGKTLRLGPIFGSQRPQPPLKTLDQRETITSTIQRPNQSSSCSCITLRVNMIGPHEFKVGLIRWKLAVWFKFKFFYQSWARHSHATRTYMAQVCVCARWKAQVSVSVSGRCRNRELSPIPLVSQLKLELPFMCH